MSGGKYLSLLAAHTKRDTILYASKWTQPAPPEMVSITEEDVQGFMEAIYGLKSENLDIVLHSPGGSAEATEGIVSYIRSKFKNVRVIVPQAAMSAATMLACSANRIVLGNTPLSDPLTRK